MWTVYCHTSPSGKRYIGITSKNPEERWRDGRGYSGQTIFGKAIKKYGWENFEHKILAENISEISAKLLEIYLIQKYRTTEREYGYNGTRGGDIRSDYYVSVEAKEKNRQSHLGRRDSEETRRKKSEARKGDKNPMWGKPRKEETRRKISQSLSGENHPMYGKKHKEETRKKMSQSQIGNTKTKGRHWFNNGEISVMRYECPEGFVSGKLTKQKT